MNTLLDLMHQVWRRRTPARPSAEVSAAVPPRRAAAAQPRPETSPRDLWAWYQSRCTESDISR